MYYILLVIGCLTSPFLFFSFSVAPLQAVEAKLSLDALLQMTGAQVRDTMRRLGSSSEECARLTAALSCLKSATESGMCSLCGTLHDQMLHHFLLSLCFYFCWVSVLSANQEVSWRMTALPGCLSPQEGTVALYWLQTSWPTWGLHSALTVPRLSPGHPPSSPPHPPPALPSLIPARALCQQCPRQRHSHHMSTAKAPSQIHSRCHSLTQLDSTDTLPPHPLLRPQSGATTVWSPPAPPHLRPAKCCTCFPTSPWRAAKATNHSWATASKPHPPTSRCS